MTAGRTTLWGAAVMVALALAPVASTADIAAAQNALLARDYATAIELAKTSHSSAPYDAALVTARAYIELGQPDKAIEFAHYAIRLVPNSFAGRMLLATAQRNSGQTIASEIQFRRALDVADTENERAIARGAMRLVENTKRWSGSLSFGIAPTTNVTKSSSSERTGTTFDYLLDNGYTVTSSVSSATGVFYGATVTRHFRGPAGAGLEFSLGQVRREYKDTDNNSTTTTFSARSTTPQTRLGQSFATFSYVTSDFAQERYTNTTSVTFGHGFQSVGTATGRVSVGIDQIDYVRSDGQVIKYRYAASHDIYKSAPVSLSLSLSGYRSVSESIAYTSKRTDVGINVALHPQQTPWRLNLSVNRGWENWDEKQSFFLYRRQDTDVTATVTVQNQNISFLGLTPVISLTEQRRDSTVDQYDLNSRDYFIGITNAF